MGDPQQAPTPQARLASTWRRYLRFWGPRADADVDDELRFHLEMRARDYAGRGLDADQARIAAEERLGDLDAVRAECLDLTARRFRRMGRAQLVDAFVQDVRYAVRALGRQKGWTAVAVVTLALGIGANTAVFSVLNSLVLHPIAYPGAERIAALEVSPSKKADTKVVVSITPSPAVAKAWLKDAHSFEVVEAYKTSDVALERGGDAAVTVRAAYLTPGFAAFADRRPLVGRMFTADEVASRAPVMLLAEATWRTRFGSAPGVLGTTITVNDVPCTVIGVMPSSFRLPRLSNASADVWLPLTIDSTAFQVNLVGRLKPGLDFAAAERELDTLDARLGAQGSRGRYQASVRTPAQSLGYRESLVLLAAAVALVLLIACANVAHLLLARAAARQRELAVRAALGAGRARLYRQLLTESLVLSAAGCAGGLAVGWLGLHALIAARPDSLPELATASMDRWALAVTVGLSLATGLIFGVAGAMHAARHSTHESLKAGALTTSHTRRHGRLRSMLVVSEMALSTVLLIAASLLVRSVIHLQQTDPGFDTRGLYAVIPGLRESRYPTVASKREFLAQMQDRIARIPGVESVTLANSAPPSFNFLMGAMQAEGEPAPDGSSMTLIRYNGVRPDYFRTMRMRLVEGSTFTDTANAAAQVVVNQGFARKHWPGQHAVGRQLRLVGYDGKGDWSTVVAVVEDAATGGLMDDRTEPMLYVPRPDQWASTVIVRAGDANALTTLRTVVAELDPHLAPPDVTGIERAMADSVSRPRFTMLLLLSFTVLALVLAAVGLYGVMAYGVAQRTREIGIRIALGATRASIARSVLSTGMRLAVGGVVLGAAAAWWATRLLDKMIFGVGRTDPVAFSAGALVLLATAALASIVPTRRASRVDPVIAMRAD